MTTTQAMTAAEDFGARLESCRVAAGSPSYRKMDQGVRDLVGPLYPGGGDETLRRWCKGEKDPRTVDPFLLGAVAVFLECEVQDFGPVAYEHYMRARDLLIQRSSCNGDSAAQMRFALAS